MSRSLVEYAVRWEPAPPYPDFSRVVYTREEAAEMLQGSAFSGEVVARRVTYEEWSAAS